MKHKLFGLQRSGTNLIRVIMRNYFNAEDCENGKEWKHGYIGTCLYDDVKLLVCVKDVHSWMRSCFQYFHVGDPTNDKQFNKRWTLNEFIHNRHYEWASPIHRWNELNEHYLSNITGNKGILLRSEDMNDEKSQIKQMERLKSFGFNQKAPFEAVTRRATNTAQLGGHFHWDYYTEKKFMQMYSTEDLEYIDGLVDHNLRRELGYD